MTRVVMVLVLDSSEVLELTLLLQRHASHVLRYPPCSDADAEMVLDVLRPGRAGAGTHTLLFYDGMEFALEHSITCRKAGLLNCPVHTAVVEQWHVIAAPFEAGDRVQIRLVGGRLLTW